jgi:endonuclease-3
LWETQFNSNLKKERDYPSGDYMTETERVIRIIELLRAATVNFTPPMSHLIKQEYGPDPYIILISCLLSLRSRDVQTYQVSKELFKQVHTPEEMIKIHKNILETILKPIGFFRRKADIVKEVSQELIDRFHGKVPADKALLLSINHIGSKTANLVLGEAFGIPAICVDIHVHRISNRLGLVKSRTPEQTEVQLQRIVPKEYWIEINKLFVMWGQNICAPISPKCSQCALLPLCPQIGVVRHR